MLAFIAGLSLVASVASAEPPSAPAVPLPIAEPIAVVEPQLPEYLKPVCNCESMGDPDVEAQQYRADGTVIEGPGNNWGMCQINATVHAERAALLGIDYMTREGNIEFAELLFAESGYRPWYQWSGHCWKNDPRIDQKVLSYSLAS